MFDYEDDGDTTWWEDFPDCNLYIDWSKSSIGTKCFKEFRIK
jgi:hypothetical protein